jgi:hypothetical protein
MLGAAAWALAPTSALAKDNILQPRATSAGTFGGIRYVEYDGVIRGQTSSGAYRVPYPNGNAITVDARGHRVPRLPIIELGEARFKSGFLGTYKRVRTIEELGYASSEAYVKAFDAKLDDFRAAGYILGEDARTMRRHAALCPGLTFTEAYRDHYEEFAGLDRCGPG